MLSACAVHQECGALCWISPQQNAECSRMQNALYDQCSAATCCTHALPHAATVMWACCCRRQVERLSRQDALAAPNLAPSPHPHADSITAMLRERVHAVRLDGTASRQLDAPATPRLAGAGTPSDSQPPLAPHGQGRGVIAMLCIAVHKRAPIISLPQLGPSMHPDDIKTCHTQV